MKQIPDHLSPEQAWERLVSCSSLPEETKPLMEALDHCLSEDFAAPEDVPAANRSFMDGYAVLGEDTRQTPVRLKLVGEVLMGEMPGRALRAGETMAIPTGGFLPEGADAVVMQEDTENGGDSVFIRRSVQPGENVQRQAEDFQKGVILFPVSHRLRPQDLSAIATFGVSHVRVYRRPTISVISTGNELIPFSHPGSDPARIRETNSLALTAAAHKFGFRSISQGIVRDEFDAQRTAMEKALENSDVVLFSGGSSVGAKDYTLEVIQSFSAHKVHFHGLAIRPGNPTIFASVGPCWIFGLPGQPVSSLIVFYEFVLPFLFHISGEKVDFASYNQAKFRSCSAVLSQSIQPLKSRTDYVRLQVQNLAHELVATPVLGKSASLSTLAMADGYTIVPPGGSLIEKGTSVTVILFP